MPLFTFDELVSAPPLPVPSIIGDGLFPEGGTWLITGKTESGKSVVAFDICLSLVLQQPLFNAFRKKHGQENKPYFPVHRSCRVLYLDNEVGPQGCHKRLEKLKESRKVQVSLGDSFKIVSGAFDPLLLHPAKDETKSFDNLRKLLETEKPDVLVVDPLGDYHLVDEDTNVMRIVFRYLRLLQQEFKFASIILHHESDKQIFNSFGATVKKHGTGRSRGHSSIAQSVDTYLAINRDKKSSQFFLELSWEKTRHQRHPPTGYVFADLNRMHLEWFCSSHEKDFKGKQDAFLRAYQAVWGGAEETEE